MLRLLRLNAVLVYSSRGVYRFRPPMQIIFAFGSGGRVEGRSGFMRFRLLLVLLLAPYVLSAGSIRAAGCDADGKVKYICGMIAPEDIIAVPRSTWVVASGYTAGGAIHLINTRTLATTQVFPTANPKLRLDKKSYASCPGPLDPNEKEKFSAHGLNIRAGSGSVHTLYVVHHGFRESVEVFEIDTQANPPTLTWIGCAVPPASVNMNSISPVPDGGFVVTNIVRRNIPPEQRQAGGNTGELWEWHPGEEWKMVPESESQTPNGIEVSKDGKWYYVNLWAASKVMRMSRGQTPVKKDVIDLDFHPDNIRWQADGSLYTAGQGGPTPQRIAECLRKFCTDATSNVARIDPRTLKVQTIIHDANTEHFISSTTGLKVGNEIWLGTSHSDRVARYPAR